MRRRASWPEILLARLAARPRALVVLDFDGTLVPTRARPELARLGAEARSTLRRLDRGGARVALMSGRSVSDLRRCVGVRGLHYGGAFGLEMAGPGWGYVHPKARAMLRALSVLARGLDTLFADVPGVRVEDKRVGFCVHYRAVAHERRREFERRLAHARAAAPRGLRWTRGRLSWEVTPRTAWDKGTAAKLLWRRLGRPYLLVIGDERFDEPMLRLAHELGAGIRVGRGSSESLRRFKDSNSVWRFLRRLADRRSVRGSRRGGR
ncbi:MAG: trehalose-phosphatase [Elusimicrobiota bacterium]